MKKAFFVLVLFSGFAFTAYALGWADPIFGKSSESGPGSTGDGAQDDAP